MKTTIYYELDRIIVIILFALFLLGVGTGLFLAHILWAFGSVFVLTGLLGVTVGIVAIKQRKKTPMELGDDFLTFFDHTGQVCIPAREITRAWYNDTGIDKKISLALQDGSTVDIPFSYGLDSLLKKIRKRYGLPK